jgi:hypothetical protein
MRYARGAIIRWQPVFRQDILPRRDFALALRHNSRAVRAKARGIETARALTKIHAADQSLEGNA